jgi:Beta-1,3-glucanase
LFLQRKEKAMPLFSHTQAESNSPRRSRLITRIAAAVVLVLVVSILAIRLSNTAFKVKADTSPSVGSGWTQCASENQNCSFSGTAAVAYGANGQYAYGSFTNGVSCSNGVFGDPNYGVGKSCYVSTSFVPPSMPPSPGIWMQCASENGTCSFSGMMNVAYGNSGHYAYGTFTNGVSCSNGVFGDPDYGVFKACFYSSAANFWGDTSSIPAASNVMMFKFLNRTNGKYPDSQVYWSFNGQTHSIADQPYFDMPVVPGSRMYFYLGSPTSQYTDFIEFNTGPSQFNGNTTRVDWFGIKLALRLHTKDGQDVSVGEDQATFAEDRSVTFQKFIDSVPTEFKHLAQIKAPYIIPAPGKMGETDFLPGGQYANYMTSYAQSLGLSATTYDIFACANSLSQNSPLCAALNRHVADLPQSQWTTPSLFYQTAPANYYAKFWHDHSINHLAYGFPYDDSGDQSTYLSYSNPQYMLVAIGW